MFTLSPAPANTLAQVLARTDGLHLST